MKPERAQVMVQGLVAGLIGYATVALLFSLIDLTSGRSPFYTAAVLGSSLFYGLEEAARVAIQPGPIIAYNGLHLVLFLVIGQVASWLMFEIEQHHNLAYFVFFLFMAAFIYGLLFVGILGAELTHVLSWWGVVLANLAWIVTMGAYLVLTHRSLMRELRAEQQVAP